jgi:hypothetical protein
MLAAQAISQGDFQRLLHQEHAYGSCAERDACPRKRHQQAEQDRSNKKPQPPCSVGSTKLRTFTAALLIAHLPPHDSKRLSPFAKKAPLTSKFIRLALILTNIEHFMDNT